MNTTKLLKSWRVKSGITIRDIDNDNLLSISGNTYNKYENNPEKMTLDILLEVVKLFNGNIEEFFYTIQQDNLSKNKGE